MLLLPRGSKPAIRVGYLTMMEGSGMDRRIPWRPRGAMAGALLGLLAVLASGLLAPQGAPPAYGLCVACHGRDFLGGLGLSEWVGLPAVSGLVLSGPGLLLGAAMAARANDEHRVRQAKRPLQSLLLGMLTMSASLLALGCTTRLALRAAYGDRLALWSVAGVAVGTAAVTGAMTWHARRAAAGGFGP